ncbi:hypothetical protein C731_1962 [Mycolicibacterium hassiacum DSM 44199]|uniref:Secreted protein n=1 Tax=Mycolicibacterium hassiacum (strain DSM 44199 / CIP 105218 / JCM 12690 / 3849) TaxID=1122247 RepID=K5BGH0_MYCHD|nr:hypothetical protein [Mycolicibacterium hassiacum]EKF24031.1 hypothetical protein C731_1962 [Mycolicibacterium hassiacum DSM 44199]MBX5485359.1 hypothetical protein [Mycolicibacterium hassiacum]MDA4086288.1 hypothetical protein [Mycolicibacterium hassiacum DSM 44199]PZN24265.1 MAG: hypothetical protein DIU75_03375 [Mycolicibacterium hassiacum]
MDVQGKAIAAVASTALALLVAVPAQADPAPCDGPECTPGIKAGVVLGAPCSDTAYFVFATAVAGPSIQPGRLVFCGSPRRYEPRYFRSPPMAGVKQLGENCTGYENWVAQSPDGLFLICQSGNGSARWSPGSG